MNSCFKTFLFSLERNSKLLYFALKLGNEKSFKKSRQLANFRRAAKIRENEMIFFIKRIFPVKKSCEHLFFYLMSKIREKQLFFDEIFAGFLRLID